ncbi:transposable element Tc1 transposase [Trichonephila clavipes]|nr:transposable element Tc1 transposase [Trichonephila clavipes]
MRRLEVAGNNGWTMADFSILMCPGLIFQQDNARPHTARVPMNCLTACQILLSPARSPDLSPIDHVWDMMRRQLHLLENNDDLR